MSPRGPKILTDCETEELFEELWDRACLERGEKPLRPDGKDSWGQIRFDFPSLFVSAQKR